MTRVPSVAGLQAADDLKADDIEFTVASEAQPSDAVLEDLRFAWRCVKHVKSNAITVAKDGRLLGMGSGQPNRVKSTEIALEKVRQQWSSGRPSGAARVAAGGH